MRSPGDYWSGMRGSSITDADLELLITGGDPSDTTLLDLAPLVAQLRGAASRSPEPGAVALFAAEASALAIAAPPSPPIPAVTRRGGRVVPRLQPIGALAAMLLVIGLGGTAYAADGAIPGEALYGLDRALESVGLGVGGADERVDEAMALFETGNTKASLKHAVEAIIAIEDEEPGVGSDTEAVVLAAVAALESETARSARPDVMELLVYLNANVHRGVGDDGRDFGQRVAELARGIGSRPDPGASNPTSDRPGPPGTNPGEGQASENQGSENQGSQGHGSQGQGQGSQGQANGNQSQGQGYGNQGQGQGNGNQGQGQVNGNQGNGQSNGNQGEGQSDENQGTSDTSADQDDTAPPIDDKTEPITSTTIGVNEKGNGNGKGNGPPAESPSITAPGRVNQP